MLKNSVYYTSFEYASLPDDSVFGASIEEIVQANRFDNNQLHKMGRNSYAVWGLDSRSGAVRDDIRNNKVSYEEARMRMKGVYLGYLRSCGSNNPQINLLSFVNVFVTVKLHNLNNWKQYRKSFGLFKQPSDSDLEIFKIIEGYIDYTWWEWTGADLAYETLCAECGYHDSPIKMSTGAIISRVEKNAADKKAASNKALRIAIENNNLEGVKQALDEGADINHKDGWPLQRAGWPDGNLDILEFLMEHPNINVNIIKGLFPCALFLKAIKSNNITEVKRILLERDPCISDEGYTRNYSEYMNIARKLKYMEIVKMLLYHWNEEYDINEITFPMTVHTHIDGCTPLMVAAADSNPEIVQLLLDEYPNDHKIMLEAKNNSGETARMISRTYMNYEGDVEIYDLLKNCGIPDKELDEFIKNYGEYPSV